MGGGAQAGGTALEEKELRVELLFDLLELIEQEAFLFLTGWRLTIFALLLTGGVLGSVKIVNR